MSNQDNVPAYLIDVNKDLAQMKAEIKRIDNLERQIIELNDRVPKTNILSKNFFSRAFAIWGHLIAITLVVYVGFTILLVLIQALSR